MPFPVSYTGQLHLSYINCSINEITASIQHGLENINATDIVKYQNNVSFFGGFFLDISTLHILTTISFGKINVQNMNNKISIKYFLNFRGALIFSLILVFGILAPFSYFHSNPDLPTEKLVWVSWLICGWLFLFGVNYLITIIRFQLFIQKVVESDCVD